MENSFALLGDEEGDDVSTFLARLANKTEAAKKAEKEQQQKRNHQSVRAESGRGTGGQGRGSGRSSGNGVQQFENGYGNGYQRSNRRANGYQHNNGGIDGYQTSAGWADGHRVNNGGADGYRGNYGGANGYRKNNGGADGYRSNNGGVNGYRKNNGGADGYQHSYGTAGNKDDGNWQGQSHGHGGARGGRGRGSGRALNENKGFENESQIVKGNQQLENQEQGEDTSSTWEKVTGKHYRNGISSYGGERRGNGGGFRARGGRVSGARGGRIHGNGDVVNDSGAKEAPGYSGDHAVYGDDDTGNVAAAVEVLKEDVQDHSGKKGEDEEVKEDKGVKEARRKAQEEEDTEKARRKAAWEEETKEEAKKMTLQQYEKQLLEKRKALEALKTEERKVIPSKDFESMQLVGKMKEDSLLIKQDTEKEKLKKKDDKVRKSVSINEFLKPAEGEYGRRGVQAQGRGGGGYQRGSSFRQAADRMNGDAWQDRLPKPAQGKERVENSHRHVGGGRGGYSRGSSSDPTIRDAQPKESVKRVPAIGDDRQFPGLVVGACVKQ